MEPDVRYLVDVLCHQSILWKHFELSGKIIKIPFYVYEIVAILMAFVMSYTWVDVPTCIIVKRSFAK